MIVRLNLLSCNNELHVGRLAALILVGSVSTISIACTVNERECVNATHPEPLHGTTHRTEAARLRLQLHCIGTAVIHMYVTIMPVLSFDMSTYSLPSWKHNEQGLLPSVAHLRASEPSLPNTQI